MTIYFSFTPNTNSNKVLIGVYLHQNKIIKQYVSLSYDYNMSEVYLQKLFFAR